MSSARMSFPLFGALIAALMIGGIACAQDAREFEGKQLGQFDEKLIRSAAKCELYKFAVFLEKHKYPVDKKYMQAQVALKWTTVDSTEAGVEISTPAGQFLPHFSFDRTIVRTESDQDISVFGITKSNQKDCIRKNKVPLGMFEKLSTSNYTDPDSPIKNSSHSIDVKATTKLTASGKATIWILNAGPSGTYSRTVTFNIGMNAPPSKSQSGGTQQKEQ